MTQGPVARAQRVGLGVVLLLGVLDAWRFISYQANPDGVSYIDIAQAFAREGPGALVNGYWSPLFPALIGIAYRLSPPTLDTMYPIAHLVGFAVFVIATLAFHHLLTAARRHIAGVGALPDRTQIVVVALGWAVYTLYILKGVGVQLLTPDMGVSAIAFWLAASALSLGAAPWTTRRWIITGAVLAIGYWWKAILFPVGLAWFLVAGFVALRRRDGTRGPAAAAGTFAALALVVAIPVSLQTGRVTFGETGRLNYLWYVNNAPYVWERCRPPGVGDAAAERFGRIAPDSLVSTAPLTCLLSSPAEGATMPMWDDPSRYYREAHPRPDIPRQLRAIRNNVNYLRDGIREYGPVTFVAFALVGLVALGAAARNARRAGRIALAAPIIGTLLAAPVAFYLLVYVEFRHLAPFVAIACVFAAWLTVSHWKSGARIALAALVLATLSDLVTRVSGQTLIGMALARSAVSGRSPERIPVTQVVARSLRSSGLEPGTRVASLYNAWNPEWAQLAGLKIRAHVPELTTPITGVLATLRDPCVRAAWDGVLRDNKIEAVVARIPVGLAAPPEFTRIADTEFHLHRVAPTPAPPAACGPARDAGGTAARRDAIRSSSGTAAR